ncbi:putative endoribonuclease l-psp protein [Botrytis fragariae]|uniref:Putative endoribonuclease l-psp protein n=1 Tax=Botrytis fragariae TaxID=1964551 RepID=A0A8H6EKW6_9HELO|nr:putative endoribonuclease l-psp protein [Botrytis fragariae]KAF5876001.1 putative endoribonuclease l-psp protein [Botrytis fragariae]
MFSRIVLRHRAIRLTSRSSLTTTLTTTPQRGTISTTHTLRAYNTILARDWSCFRCGRHKYANKEASLCRQSKRSITTINSANLPAHTKPATAIGPYSHAVQTPFGIFVSGQLPADFEGNLVEGTIREKTEAVLKNLQEVLVTAKSSLDRIVKVQVFLTDMKDFAEMNEEYEKWITHKPARSCVAVKELPKGVNIEIECIALPSITGPRE